MLRNETKATERRAKRANWKAMAQRAGGLVPAMAHTKAASTARAPESSAAIVPALNASPEQLASCYFVSNFIILPRQGSGRGYMDYLIPLLKAETPDCRILTHAFNACALASLGNRVTSNGVDFADRALSEYTRALAETNVALRHAELSKTEGMLATVLLLGLFEVRLELAAGGTRSAERAGPS